MKLELVAFAPRGDLLLELRVAGRTATGRARSCCGAWRTASVVAMYDVVGVSALAIAPDGERFMYSTGAGRTYTALARVPR